MSMAAMRIRGRGGPSRQDCASLHGRYILAARSTVSRQPSRLGKSYHEPCSGPRDPPAARAPRASAQATSAGRRSKVTASASTRRASRPAACVRRCRCSAKTSRAASRTRPLGKVRRLTRALGAVRELDVTLAVLDELAAQGHPAARRARRSAGARGRGARVAARDDAEAAREGQGREAGSAAGVGRRGAAGCRSRALARDVVRRGWPSAAKALAAAIASAGQMYNPERLHQVRIATKKLRYGLEIAAESGHPVRRRAGAAAEADAGYARPAARPAGARGCTSRPSRRSRRSAQLPDWQPADGRAGASRRSAGTCTAATCRCRPRCWPRCKASGTVVADLVRPARRRSLKMALPSEAASADRGRSARRSRAAADRRQTLTACRHSSSI